jgi:hypothetical protein
MNGPGWLAHASRPPADHQNLEPLPRTACVRPRDGGHAGTVVADRGDLRSAPWDVRVARDDQPSLAGHDRYPLPVLRPSCDRARRSYPPVNNCYGITWKPDFWPQRRHDLGQAKGVLVVEREAPGGSPTTGPACLSNCGHEGPDGVISGTDASEIWTSCPPGAAGGEEAALEVGYGGCTVRTGSRRRSI